MQDFLFDLFCYCTDRMEPACGREYEADRARFAALEREMEARMGPAFREEYEKAEYCLSRWETLAIFRQGLSFGARFALAVLGQSSSVSAP